MGRLPSRRHGGDRGTDMQAGFAYFFCFAGDDGDVRGAPNNPDGRI